MSGHSKWHSIKRKKAVIDSARGKIFTKHAKLIAIASRDGGGDPDSNAALRTAIDNAKKDNMPNANIERAIKKGSGGDKEGMQIFEIVYEGYGPGGTAFLVECLTDNKNRAVSNVKHAFSKNGGNLAEAGAVAWMFKKHGVIAFNKTNLDTEKLELLAIESGACDIREYEEHIEIFTEPADLYEVLTALRNNRFEPENAQLKFVANMQVKVSDKAEAEKIMKLIDVLEEDDEVGEVYTNVEFDDAVFE
jgi:YebC/PmpR family DNA-binding regulatory protein